MPPTILKALKELLTSVANEFEGLRLLCKGLKSTDVAKKDEIIFNTIVTFETSMTLFATEAIRYIAADFLEHVGVINDSKALVDGSVVHITDVNPEDFKFFNTKTAKA